MGYRMGYRYSRYGGQALTFTKMENYMYWNPTKLRERLPLQCRIVILRYNYRQKSPTIALGAWGGLGCVIETRSESHALLLRSSSFVDLPPTFCVSRVLACYASVWGPEYLWTIALYWGYKIRNLLEKLEKLPLLALVTISLVFVSSLLATQ